MQKKIPFLKKLILDILSYLGYSLHSTKIKPKIGKPSLDERTEFLFKKELIEIDNPVIFDVGAHVGTVTKIYRRFFPMATIYSFEPFSSSFEELFNAVNGDSRIFCHNIALSKNSGKAVLNANIFSQTNSLLETDSRATINWKRDMFETVSQEEVDTTTIDEFCKQNGISNIDLLKIDVQGLEYSVFEGAAEMLSSQRISIIYFEIIVVPTYKEQPLLKDYFSLLDSFGYEFVNSYNPKIVRSQLVEMNVLFVSSSFKKQSRILSQ